MPHNNVRDVINSSVSKAFSEAQAYVRMRDCIDANCLSFPRWCWDGSIYVRDYVMDIMVVIHWDNELRLRLVQDLDKLGWKIKYDSPRDPNSVT